MPRPATGPKLWLDRKRGTWTIIDAGKNIRTGIAESDRSQAILRLHDYAAGRWYSHPAFEAPKPNRECGVYVIGFGPYVKIGKTMNLKKRLAGLQTPEPVQVYGWLAGYGSREALLHAKYSKYRINGEWFRREGELAEWINGGCND